MVWTTWVEAADVVVPQGSGGHAGRAFRLSWRRCRRSLAQEDRGRLLRKLVQRLEADLVDPHEHADHAPVLRVLPHRERQVRDAGGDRAQGLRGHPGPEEAQAFAQSADLAGRLGRGRVLRRRTDSRLAQDARSVLCGLVLPRRHVRRHRHRLGVPGLRRPHGDHGPSRGQAQHDAADPRLPQGAGLAQARHRRAAAGRCRPTARTTWRSRSSCANCRRSWTSSTS